MNIQHKFPKVTIGIPTYNRPEFLERCLDGLIGQTYENIEIIISDNASTNASVKKISEKYVLRDDRIKYFRQENNIGPARNFQFLLNQAETDYFMWAGDDDYRSPDFVEQMIKSLLENPRASVAFCDFIAVDESDNKIENYPNFYSKMKFFVKNNRVLRLLSYFNQKEKFGKANLIYGLMRSRCIPDFNPFSFSKYGGDMHFVYRLLANGPAVICDKKLYKSAVGNVKFHTKNDFENGKFYKNIMIINQFCEYVFHYIKISPASIKPLILLLIPMKIISLIFNAIFLPFLLNKISSVRG